MISKKKTGTITSIAAAIALAAGAAFTVGVPSVNAHPGHGDHATAQVEKAEVGKHAPDFTLVDINGNSHTLSEVLAEDGVNAVVLEWFNADCPFVKKHHQHNKTMANLASKYEAKGVRWIAINTGEEGKQGAGLDRNKRAADEFSMKYPILLDTSGDIGRMYGARTTPHMYVIDSEGVLKYAGAIDNNPSARQVGDVIYVEEALDAVLAGETVETPTSRPYGCSVKY